MTGIRSEYMRKVDVKEKVSELVPELPPTEEFWELGDLTALRNGKDGRFYRSNYERGLLLYALVTKFRPKVVLEFGTGRGYGALCMARAMAENSIDGDIYTINLRRFDERLEWAIDEGDGPRVDNLSLKDVWAKHMPLDWTSRIHHMCGSSTEIMGRWKRSGLPSPDLAFIDGGHDYLTVKHDFYSMLDVAAPAHRILFDDYALRLDFGVCKLIDQYVDHIYQTELVFTDRRWIGGEFEHVKDPSTGMIFIDSERMMPSEEVAQSAIRRRFFLTGYRFRRRLGNTPLAGLAAAARRATSGPMEKPA